MEHSPCSSSSLKRRNLCSASLSEEYGLEEVETERAKDGIRKHKFAENVLKGEMELTDVPAEDAVAVKDAIEMLFEALGDDFLPDGRTANGGKWFLEKRLKCLSTAAEGREDWGTSDVIVIYKAEKRAFVGDFKFGGGLIDHPMWNYQLQDYACNLWDTLGHDWVVEASYFQPSARGLYRNQPWAFHPEELHKIAAKLKAIREDAYGPSPVYKIGPACQFCVAAARGSCWARNATLSEFIAKRLELSIEGMSTEQLSDVMSMVRSAKKDAERIYKMIHDVMAGGVDIPGYRYNPSTNRVNETPASLGIAPANLSVKKPCINA